jgi:ribonuclease Z
MRRILLVAGGAIVILIAGAWLATLSPNVDVWLYRKMAAHIIDRPVPQLAQPGELSVLLCGTGSPLPDPNRASACTVVAAGDRLYVVDSGLSSVRNLLLWRIPLEKIDGVFLTHFHSDHIAELGELRLQTWGAGRRTPLKVYGPPGVEDVVAGFNQAYSHDADYRTLHHGEKFLPREVVDMVAVPIPMNGATAQVFDDGGLKVTAIKVHHDPVKPAYGYRFDFNGRSVTISGDTAYYEPTPVEAARIANLAGAKLLVFTHINPPLPNFLAERAFLRGVSDVRPNGWLMGRDGTLIRLPGHSDEIEETAVQ